MKFSNVKLIGFLIIGVFIALNSGCQTSEEAEETEFTGVYPVVDTGQVKYYNNQQEITAPASGEEFYGQDANYSGYTPSYTDNGDGTITDNVTGMMWQKSPDTNGDGVIDYDDKMFYDEALSGASSFNLAGYSDWRLPTIKELYSLIMYFGAEPNPSATEQSSAVPFIDIDYFDFGYGDLDAGERIIDAQFATSTLYVSTTMNGNETMFGVNFADGRIKGYPSSQTNGKKYYILYVRGNTAYGTNEFVDNGDGTITDCATGLMWMQNDNGEGVLWKNALSYAENSEHAGHTDWRLPNAKELQSIVDYTRSPSTTGSAAIDPVFNCTQIINEAGDTDYPFYWSSTTFCSQSSTNGQEAVYVSFGRAMGYMAQHGGWIDVHGAGAQRSDPKTGNPNNFPFGRGPQGDAMRIYNCVRCVRSGIAEPRESGPKVQMKQPYHLLQQNGRRHEQGGRLIEPNNQGRVRQRHSRADFVRRLDRDGDGKVSREEFDGPKEHFNHFDKNGDGFISRKEAPQGPPREQHYKRDASKNFKQAVL